MLHLSKVAVGCDGVEALRRRQHARLQQGIVPVATRHRPRRADELIGGSLYWIIRHRYVVRQTIIGFADSEADRRTIIRLDPELVPVVAQPKRAHQGWRYLGEADVPADLRGADDGSEALPLELAERLALLALI